jgi:hypothetical protein
VRKEGVEPSRELPHRNLNGVAHDSSTRNCDDLSRQEMSDNVELRHDSGRTGPVQDLLERARKRWASAGDPAALRRDLLDVLRCLERDE